MAHIQRRKTNAGWRYKVRYIDPDGKERSKTFARKADAEMFQTSVSHQIYSHSYVDPARSAVTVRAYLEEWMRQQSHWRPKTAAITATRMRTMVFPYLGDVRLGRVEPSTIRSWQATLAGSGRYAESTVKNVRGILAGAFNDAVTDRVLSSNPCDGVKGPRPPKRLIIPKTRAQVETVRGTILPRYAGAVWLAAGSGLRPSEVFGLTVDRVDFLRKSVLVDRQLVGRQGTTPLFGPPKTKASVRRVPLPDVVVEDLARHIARFPPGEAGLIFTTSRGGPITRGVFGEAWRPAARAAGFAPAEGLHQMRHYYASVLIAAGRSVKEVQARLGHESAMETLDTYSHLFPDSEEGTRAAIDAALRGDTPHLELRPGAPVHYVASHDNAGGHP